MEHRCTPPPVVLLVRLTHGYSYRFMVDKGSDLYYDPSPLTGKESKPEPPDRGGELADRHGQIPHTPQKPHPLDTRLQHPHAYQQQLGPMHGQMQSPNMQHHPGMMGGFPGGSPYGVQQQVPPDQFYGGGSPMHLRPPHMGGMPQDHAMSPDIRRRVTRAMSDEYQMQGM